MDRYLYSIRLQLINVHKIHVNGANFIANIFCSFLFLHNNTKN